MEGVASETAGPRSNAHSAQRSLMRPGVFVTSPEPQQAAGLAEVQQAPHTVPRVQCSIVLHGGRPGPRLLGPAVTFQDPPLPSSSPSLQSLQPSGEKKNRTATKWVTQGLNQLSKGPGFAQ